MATTVEVDMFRKAAACKGFVLFLQKQAINEKGNVCFLKAHFPNLVELLDENNP